MAGLAQDEAPTGSRKVANFGEFSIATFHLPDWTSRPFHFAPAETVLLLFLCLQISAEPLALPPAAEPHPGRPRLRHRDGYPQDDERR